MTHVRLSSPSRAASEIDPSVSGSSHSPSPMKAHTRDALGVLQLPVVEVLVEPGVVDRAQPAQPHRHRGELPEVGHQPGVGVGRQPAAADLPPEVVELVLGEPALEERPRVDARRGVALEVDVVAGEPVVLAAEEVVEADLVEGGGAGEGGEVAADAVGVLVGLDDHDGGVPADERADPPLDVLVAREERLLLGGDRVDVRRGHRRGGADLQLACALEQLGHEEPGARLAVRAHHRIERVEPLLRLPGIRVGELVDESVDDHVPIISPPPAGCATIQP